MSDQVIYLAQQGTDGPVRIGAVDLNHLNRHIARLQEGNPEQLHVRRLFTNNDPLLVAKLQVANADHHLLGDWFTSPLLNNLPDGLVDVPVPGQLTAEEQARQDAIETLKGFARSARDA